MTIDMEMSEKNTSIYYPFFQNMFELADMTSFAWQPLLKAIGRTHLEFVGLQAKQTRAMVHWAHRLTRPATPADFFQANTQLWTVMLQGYLDSAPRVAAAVETATEVVAPKKVHELPAKPLHDALILLDRDDVVERERKVA